MNILKNDEIKASRVILIDDEGKRLGEFLKTDAIQLAEEKGYDLIQVGGKDDSPICKMMDYGKLLYEKKKKQKQSHSAVIKVKEIRLGVNTDEHDLAIREKQARKFLSEGDKVKVVVKYTGREGQHLDLVRAKCLGFAQRLKDVAIVEEQLSFGQKQAFLVMGEKRENG